MKNTEAKNKWVSIYIFFDGSENAFLNQAVYPLTRSLHEKGLIRKYFFVRYYEEGQHIRLRCDWANDFSEGELQVVLKNWAAGLINRIQSPDYTVTRYQFQQYIPELERYGGVTGISLCEDFFCACSQVVLNYIHHNENITYEQMLAFAFKLHVSFIVLMESRTSEQISFFHDISMQWADQSQYFLEMWRGKPGNAAEEVDRLYQRSYLAQKDIFHEIALNTIEEVVGLQGMEDYMRSWKQAVLSLKEGLYLINGHSDFNSFKYILWSIVHMTNNRLGVINMDESFLGYVLTESIKAINHDNPVHHATNGRNTITQS